MSSEDVLSVKSKPDCSDFQSGEEDKEAYIAWHQQLERKVIDIILRIEKQFHAYYDLYKKELKIQLNLVDKLWIISNRYIILTQRSIKCSILNSYEVAAEGMLIANFHNILEQISNSIQTLELFLSEPLRPLYRDFRRIVPELNMDAETPVMMGDAYHKPMSFFIELVDDVFNFLHYGCLKLDYHCNELDVNDLDTLKCYRKLLEPCQEFEEYFLVGMTYCQCLKSPPKYEHFNKTPLSECDEVKLLQKYKRKPRKVYNLAAIIRT